MKAKGVMLDQTNIRHGSYLEAYNNGVITVKQRRIASQQHQLVTMEQNKMALKCFNDKRN